MSTLRLLIKSKISGELLLIKGPPELCPSSYLTTDVELKSQAVVVDVLECMSRLEAVAAVVELEVLRVGAGKVVGAELAVGVLGIRLCWGLEPARLALISVGLFDCAASLGL